MIWGFLPIFFKEIKAYNLYQIIVYRIVISTLAMILLIIITREIKQQIQQFKAMNSRKKFASLALTTFGAIMITINWTTYVYVVNEISINASAFAYMILPITTAFIAFITLKEQLTRNKWIGIILGAISCYLLANVDIEQILYILTVTLSYSFYMVSQRRNHYFNRKMSLTIQLFIGSIIMLIFIPELDQNLATDTFFLGNLGIIVILFTITPLLLNLYALNQIQASQLSFMVYISPITSFIIGILFYGELIGTVEILAYTILLIAVVIFNFDLIKKILKKKATKSGS